LRPRRATRARAPRRRHLPRRGDLRRRPPRDRHRARRLGPRDRRPARSWRGDSHRPPGVASPSMRLWPLVLVSACASSVHERPDAALLAATQAMMEGVAAGDKTVWDRTLAPDAVYTAEDGAVKDKTMLLAELEPLPPGISGKIQVVDMKVRDFGAFAVTTWVAD